MCIAIYRPKGKKLTKATLETCFRNNSDGAGFMWLDKHEGEERGRIKIRKGYFVFAEFWKAWQRQLKRLDTDYILHFRIMTHGWRNKENCHPHRIHDRLAMVHNGILPIDVPQHSRVSDSIVFARELAQMRRHWERDAKLIRYIGKQIQGNKIILLDRRGKVTIINEAAGIWENGIWFSNSSFKAPKYKYIRNHQPYHYADYSHGYQLGNEWYRPGERSKTAEPKLCALCGCILLSSERETNVCIDCELENNGNALEIALQRAEAEDLADWPASRTEPREYCTLCHEAPLLTDTAILRGYCWQCAEMLTDVKKTAEKANAKKIVNSKGFYLRCKKCLTTLITDWSQRNGICHTCHAEEAERDLTD